MDTYTRFVTSIAQADHNVLIIFGMALAAVLAGYSINLLPPRTRPAARLIGWLYAVLALVLTVIYSRG